MILVDKALQHLSEDELNELINKYYDGFKIKDLIIKYNIVGYKTNIHRLFPPAKLEEKCIYCNSSLYQERISRSSYSYKGPKFCLSCGHKVESYCECDVCELERKKQAEAKRLIEIQFEEKRKIIRRQIEEERKIKQQKLEEERKRNLEIKIELIEEYYSYNNMEYVSLSNLTTKQIIYLGALITGCMSEDLTKIVALSNLDVKLGVTDDQSIEIINELYDNNIILVDKSTNLDSFYNDASFNIYSMNYLLNLSAEDFEKLMCIVYSDNILELDLDYNEVLEIWKEIAQSEALEFLIKSMNEVNFDFNPGEKTREIFKFMTDNFSTGQIYQIINNSIGKSTRYYQSGKVSRNHASNSVITHCQLYAERAILNNWNITGCYYRDKECKQSVLSQFLYSKILKLGEKGFNIVPKLENINVVY